MRVQRNRGLLVGLTYPEENLMDESPIPVAGDEPLDPDEVRWITAYLASMRSHVDDYAEAMPSLLTDRQRYEGVIDLDYAAPAARRFVADTLRKAEWCARKLRPLTAHRDEVKENAKRWKAEIDEWERGELAATDGFIAFLEFHLGRYALGQRDATGAATTKLPSATIKTTNVQASVKVADEDAVAAWAKTVFDPTLFEHDPDKAAAAKEALDAILKVTEKVLVPGVKSHVQLVETQTGRSVLELGCGCTVTLVEDVGDEAGAECPTHGLVAVVKRAPEVLLVGSYGSDPVPGVEVVPQHVSVKVVPTP